MQSAVSTRNRPARGAGGEALLARALACREAVGTREFHVSPPEMAGLLNRALSGVPRPILSLNRPHTDGRNVVHRLEWRGLVFTCVSKRSLEVD
jgi:hypothetical protein